MPKFRLSSRKISGAVTSASAVEGSTPSSTAVSSIEPVLEQNETAAFEPLATASTEACQAPTAQAPSRKGRRKSYGGIRSLLGKTRNESVGGEVPPVPAVPRTAHSRSLNKKSLYINDKLDCSNTSLQHGPDSGPSSPAFTESRPSTSSLRPFPFLNIRRKSSNQSNSLKPIAISGVSLTNEELKSSSPSSPSRWGPRVASNRLQSYAASKRAQSVDDLSQFGLIPDRDRDRHKGRWCKPRRSAELERSPVLSGPASGDLMAGLHRSLDKIGELAGTLARLPSPADDRQPRLSNPKSMRTVYGIALQDLFWRDGNEFPLLVGELVGLVEKHGLDQQGIYRVPGEKRVIEELQTALDEKGVKGVDIWKAVYRDAHNVAGALKLFLRELPGGVVPFGSYDDFIAVNVVPSDEQKTVILRRLVRGLPEANRILLRRLSNHFANVVTHAENNSMQAHNMAIVFAPSIFRSGSEASNPLLSFQNIGAASAVVRHLISDADTIFSDNDIDGDGNASETSTSSVSAHGIITAAPDAESEGLEYEEMEQLASPVEPEMTQIAETVSI